MTLLVQPDVSALRSARGPSPSIWDPAEVLGVLSGAIDGLYYHDDFERFNGTVTTNVGTYSGGWYSFEDSGGTIIGLASVAGGAIRIATDNSDNDDMTLALGNVTAAHFKVASSGGTKLCMEARVRLQEVASRNFLFALCEEGLAVTDGLVTDSGALTSKDMIGFHSLEGDATAIDTFYRKAGQTAATVQDDVHTITADGWVKLGLVFDPTKVDKAVRFFVDGVECTSAIARGTLDDSTFPDGEELIPYFNIKNGTTTITRVDLDWFRIMQLQA